MLKPDSVVGGSVSGLFGKPTQWLRDAPEHKSQMTRWVLLICCRLAPRAYTVGRPHYDLTQQEAGAALRHTEFSPTCLPLLGS